MFLRATTRKKDGKEHHYWSIVENRRLTDGRVLQRHVLYLGEINASQELAWRKSIDVFEDGAKAPQTVALFPEDRCEGVVPDEAVVRLRLRELRLCRPRQWGGCRLALWLWQELRLDEFWAKRLLPSRKGTRWDRVLFVLVAYRLLAPGSEWRLHREWYERSALADLLGADAALCDIHTLYRCHDRLIEHKRAVFDHLTDRWRDLFNVSFDVLLYDLTSTYFECDPPQADDAKRRFGHSRDKRYDCVQVVIALVVTPEGLPLAYEVWRAIPRTIPPCVISWRGSSGQYGRARRIWAMDRGIPTEAVLAEMREGDPPVHYLVGTPKGRLTRLEKALLAQAVAGSPAGGGREAPAKGRGTLCLRAEPGSRRQGAGNAATTAEVVVGASQAALDDGAHARGTVDEARRRARQGPGRVALGRSQVAEKEATFRYRLHRDKLRQARRREGRYLLRTNLTENDPAKLWNFYLQLVAVEEAFKNLKGDLAIRPIFHQVQGRIEAHIFIAFLAYCLHVTLTRRLHPLAPGLTPRSVIEKFAAMQMIDVHIPTTDGRELSSPDIPSLIPS